MKSRSHWNARYVLNRTLLEVHERRHPDDPWWTAASVSMLDSLLRRSDSCFEWGSGRSTAWLAKRVSSVISVEHDARWYAQMRPKLRDLPADIHLVPGEEEAYVAPISEHDELDIVIVDGLFRDACALAALDRLRPCGLLLIDNVERHLPNRSLSPESIGDRYENELWREFGRRTETWRQLWTSNGVRDTAIFLVGDT